MGAYEDNQTALFERLLKPYLERLYRLAFRLTHDKAEAEDLFQDVLTKLFGKLDELTELRDPGPWLNRVLYNHFIDNKRRYARRRLTTVEEGQLPAQSIETLADNAAETPDSEREFNIRSLQNALDQLSDEHRTVMMLHDAEGYKLQEIQKITGDPVGTIKQCARRRGRQIVPTIFSTWRECGFG